MAIPEPRDLILRDLFTLVAAVVKRPVVRGRPETGLIAHPEPIAAITAAMRLRDEAGRAIREQARWAREDGKTWTQIGEALSTDQATAFLTVASDLGAGLSFAWRCPSCGQMVLDQGPDYGPQEDEQGHADGCERFAATVRAWNAQWEDGEGE